MIKYEEDVVIHNFKKPNSLSCKLIDFVVETGSDFVMQMFGIDEKRKTYSITIKNYKPFFYIKIPNEWNFDIIGEYIHDIKTNIDAEEKKYNIKYDIVKHHKLYGFDGYKDHKFIKIICENTFPINAIKNLFYDREKQKVFKNGYEFNNQSTFIYEVQIPPLLRFFHIQNISPSGWIEVSKYRNVTKRKTRCDYEIMCNYSCIKSLIDKEDSVPYKICSFDIEASSSHGDFPLAVKNYNKVAYEIINYIDSHNIQNEDYEKIIYNLLHTAFGFDDTYEIDFIYLKNKKIMNSEYFDKCFNKLITHDISSIKSNLNDESILSYLNNIERKCEDGEKDELETTVNDIYDDESINYRKKSNRNKKVKKSNIITFLQNSENDKVEKTKKLTEFSFLNPAS